MNRRVVLASLLLLLPSVASAQTARDSCSWEDCALRVRARGWFSPAKVVRGIDGVTVARFDRADTLRTLFGVSDSARAHYDLFAASDRRADALSGIGGALLLASVIVGVTDDDPDSPWAFGLSFAGLGLSLLAVRPRSRSSTELETAIWWYNRSLRSPSSRE